MSKFIKTLAKRSLQENKRSFLDAREEYYNQGNSSLTDAEFDALEEYLRKQVPNWKPLKGTGIKVGKKTDVELDMPMPSLDKIQAGNPTKLVAFLRKIGLNSVVGEKLDGSSIQAVYVKGKLTRLATRGDGVTGKDISYFIPHVNLPLTVSEWKSYSKVVLRLEAVMPIKVYAKKWEGEFDSARALASSVFNRQDVHPAMKDVQLIVLRVLLIDDSVPSLSTGLAFAKKAGLKCQRHLLKKKPFLNDEWLTELLAKWRKDAEFETDGLVICDDGEELEITGERPEYARAFKVNDEENAPITEIVRIQWRPSRHGLLVPKAIIKPIQFGKVTVKQAALHNAKWALERRCGVGAVVRVLRSGDIIPKIVGVEKGAQFKLPSKETFGDYEWDDTNTSLRLVDKNANREVLIRQFTNFFQKLELDQMSEGIAEKLVDVGATKTYQLVGLTEEHFARLPGVKSSAKTYGAQMKRIRDGEFDIIKLMVASGCFEKGVGSTRLKTAFEAIPDLAIKWPLGWEERLAKTHGCGPVFAKQFAAGVPKFSEWLRKSGANIADPVKPKKTVKGSLTGQYFSWTGYRSKEEESIIEKNGGAIVPFGGKTDVLFYKPDGKASSKVSKAKEKGIRTVQFNKFKV